MSEDPELLSLLHLAVGQNPLGQNSRTFTFVFPLHIFPLHSSLPPLTLSPSVTYIPMWIYTPDNLIRVYNSSALEKRLLSGLDTQNGLGWTCLCTPEMHGLTSSFTPGPFLLPSSALRRLQVLAGGGEVSWAAATVSPTADGPEVQRTWNRNVSRKHFQKHSLAGPLFWLILCQLHTIWSHLGRGNLNLDNAPTRWVFGQACG